MPVLQVVRVGRRLLVLQLLRLLEPRRLGDPHAEVDGDRTERDREQERDAPAPFDHRAVDAEQVLGDEGRDGDHRGARGEAEVGADVELRRPVAAVLVGRELGDVGGGAGEFAARREALHHLEQVERDDDPVAAGLRRRGQHADERGRDRHDRHGEVEHLLAADAIADGAEDQAAEGADEEGDGEAEQRDGESERVGHAGGEHLGHGHGEVAVDAEVVPLHEVADEGTAEREPHLRPLDDDDVVDLQAAGLRGILGVAGGLRHRCLLLGVGPGGPSMRNGLRCCEPTRSARGRTNRVDRPAPARC